MCIQIRTLVDVTLNFRENHPGNKNFSRKLSRKRKFSRNFAKSERIFAYFSFSRKLKKFFFVQRQKYSRTFCYTSLSATLTVYKGTRNQDINCEFSIVIYFTIVIL
jgi:hypothetical protein